MIVQRGPGMVEKDPKSVEIITGKSSKNLISTVKLRINRYSTCTDEIKHNILFRLCKIIFNDDNIMSWFLQYIKIGPKVWN